MVSQARLAPEAVQALMEMTVIKDRPGKRVRPVSQARMVYAVYQVDLDQLVVQELPQWLSYKTKRLH